jgi:hypothetical protein
MELQPTDEELQKLRSQIVISRWRDNRRLSYAFIEYESCNAKQRIKLNKL